MLLPLLLVRQFLFLVLIDTLLTSNPAFARDRRRDSVPASAMARFIEERQTVEFLAGCPVNPGPNDEDNDCLFDQGNLQACQDTVANNDFQPLLDCLNGLCPNNTPGVNFCEAAKALDLIQVV
jgi:hypothetical protein